MSQIIQMGIRILYGTDYSVLAHINISINFADNIFLCYGQTAT